MLIVTIIPCRSKDFTRTPLRKDLWDLINATTADTFVASFNDVYESTYTSYALSQKFLRSDWEKYYSERQVVRVRKQAG